MLGLAREKWKPVEELGEYASKRPHIDRRRIPDPQYYFRGPIKPTLNIGIDLLLLEAAAPHIDHLNPTFVFLLEHDVLGFKVAVDDVVFAEKVQSL